MTRPVYQIARTILKDPTLDRTSRRTAGPYLGAMLVMTTLSERYGADDGQAIGRYALENLKTWRGETARALKAEIREHLG